MQTVGIGGCVHALFPAPGPVPGGCGQVWGDPDVPFPLSGTMTPTGTQHSLAGQTYAVPLIQPDLRREEAIQQVADALQYLQKVSGDIFSRWVPLPGSRLSSPKGTLSEHLCGYSRS